LPWIVVDDDGRLHVVVGGHALALLLREPARNSPELRCLSVMFDSLLSVRLLPTDVITKQFDCCTARRISGSMVVILVAAPKLAYHSLPRPSSTASVPSGVSQRSSAGLAFTLVAPPAAPVDAVAAVPVLMEPPPRLAQPASARDATKAAARKEIFLDMKSCSC
jgi:hypothetical protein